MSQLKKLEHIQLTINSLSFGKGAGVGRHQGFVVFVAKTCPGDVVLCEITLVKKNFAEARLLEIITPGKNRRTPPCPVAFECGGCQWQQVSYERQLAEKQSLLLRTFSPLVSDPSKIAQIVASPKEFGYRNRIQVHFKNGQLGFLKQTSETLIPIEYCAIAEKVINDELPNVLKHDYKNSKKIEIRTNMSQEVTITEVSLDDVGDRFSQVNSHVNEILLNHILSWAPKTAKVACDLFSGNGNLTFPLAKLLKNTKFHAVELGEHSHQIAQQQAQNQNLTNIDFHNQSVESFLSKNFELKPDFIILDPPRAGLSTKAMTNLKRFSTPNLIYMSCDPMTLKRDLTELVKNGEYHIEKIQPFDMFPQTFHVEVLVALKKGDETAR